MQNNFLIVGLGGKIVEIYLQLLQVSASMLANSYQAGPLFKVSRFPTQTITGEGEFRSRQTIAASRASGMNRYHVMRTVRSQKISKNPMRSLQSNCHSSNAQ